MEYQTVRTRFAPSPTGYLHIGGLRTALYNYLFAKKHGGDFILRIEDTDQKRLVDDATKKLVKTLGIFFEWNEGLRQKAGSKEPGATLETQNFGEYGPYVQSERLDIYKEYAEKLIATGKAYRCFCTSERLDALRKEQQAQKEPTRYDGRCHTLSATETDTALSEGKPSVIRLRVDAGEDVHVIDLVRGELSFSRNTIDDQVLLKSDGFPTYHLASVVDDHLMKITHVIRGEEWLPSTPKHVLLYEAFGWTPPAFAHIPLLLNPDRSKLSKRQGDVSVEEYLAKGYLPEALVNFVALLGWNPGEGSTQEIFSMDELIEHFDLDHVHKGGAVFDVKKLDWLSAEYLKKLSEEDFAIQALHFLEKKPWFIKLPPEAKTPEIIRRASHIERDRIAKLSDIGEASRFFFEDPAIEPTLIPWKGNSPEITITTLQNAYTLLSELQDDAWEHHEHLSAILLDAAGEKRGDFLWPLRAALSGEKKSPPPGEIAWVIGREASLRRIQATMNSLKR